jgi:hypothetical protein
MFSVPGWWARWTFAPGFAAEPGRPGYTSNSASQHMCFIAHLSRWMLARLSLDRPRLSLDREGHRGCSQGKYGCISIFECL